MTDAPFGPGCASVPADGKGSFAGMAKEPVATAASNNQLLSTLVAAVKKAGLVDTLNNSKNITVFAPSNSAFDKIPKADLDKVLADKTTLTHLLTHHVVPSRLAPAALAGTHPTLNSDSVKVSGTTPDFDVAGAKVALRQCADRQRHCLHRRHRADADEVANHLRERVQIREPGSRVVQTLAEVRLTV